MLAPRWGCRAAALLPQCRELGVANHGQHHADAICPRCREWSPRAARGRRRPRRSDPDPL